MKVRTKRSVLATVLVIGLVGAMVALLRPALAEPAGPPEQALPSDLRLMSAREVPMPCAPGATCTFQFCMQVDPGSMYVSGTQVTAGFCSAEYWGQAVNQRWLIRSNTGGTVNLDGVRISLEETRSGPNGGGMCLDADTSTAPADGTRVQIWECNGTDQQLWDLYELPGGPQGYTEHVIANRYASNLAGRLVVLDLKVTTGVVQLYHHKGYSNQMWNQPFMGAYSSPMP